MKPIPQSRCAWYFGGKTLIQILDELPVPPREECGHLRIPILDKMIDRGVVVFGKVESGTVRLGDNLIIMPSGVSCQVITVYNSKDECVMYAKPGENVKLRLDI
jgi:translation elongation factor EF-1alpha